MASAYVSPPENCLDYRHSDNVVFVVVEGIDGAGTTTLVKALAQSLFDSLPPFSKEHYDVRERREPSTSDAGRMARKLIDDPNRVVNDTNLALLFASDRHTHVGRIDRELRDSAELFQVVIMDRYIPSSLAYQCADRKELMSWVMTLNEHMPRPDLTLFLDASPSVCRERIEGRDEASTKGSATASMLALEKNRASYSRALNFLKRHVQWGQIDEIDAELSKSKVLEIARDLVVPIVRMKWGRYLTENRPDVDRLENTLSEEA